MKKATIAFLMILVLICSTLPVMVSAATDGTAVSNAADFEAMVTGGTYYLTKDIDLGGKEYDCCIFAEFSGTIDGNGYCVYNYSINNNGAESDCGTILRSNKTGNLTITDLTFGKEGNPVKLYSTASGKSTGIICGAQENANTMTLTNVTVYGEIEVATAGKGNIGGYIGYSRAFTLTSCKMYGSVTVGSGIDMVDTVYHNAGGYVGSANSDLAVLDNCENHAIITSYCSTVEARAAGFIAYTGTSIQLMNCVNYGNVSCPDTSTQLSSSQCAGFIGHVNKATSSAFLTNCENKGTVTGSNYCSPFVANLTGAAYYEGCVNSGTYSKDSLASGAFAGFVDVSGIVDLDAFCIDKTDPNATTPAAETTTTAPETTAAPVETTTAAPVETATAAPAEDTTATPAEDTTATPAEDTTATPAEDTTDTASGGCGSIVASPILLVLFGGAAYGIIKKKENN